MPRILLIDDDAQLGPPLAAYFQRFDLTLEQALQKARAAAKPGEVEVSTGAFNVTPRYGRDGVVQGWQGTAELLLQGRDALAVLQRLCANQIDVPVGRLVYTAMLNARGGFESDLTIIRQKPDRFGDRFLIVTGSSQATRDFDWISRHIEPTEHAVLTDLSALYCVLSIMGPNADALLAERDFFEVETGREVRVFGNIAHVWSAYEARHAPDDAVPERRGINSIQLYRGEEGWKIIHMIWDNERDGVPLPAVG